MRRLLALLLLLMSVPLWPAKAAPASAADMQSRVADLAGKLKAHEVRRVEIIQMPPRMLTRTRVTPEMLERSFHYKLVLADLRGGAYAASLSSVVAAMSAEPSVEMADLRWGVTYYDQNEQRIVSFYFDKSGRRGAVDTAPAAFTGDMVRWLDENFSGIFK